MHRVLVAGLPALVLLQCSAAPARDSVPPDPAWNPGPAVGQPLPPFQAPDQHGSVQTFASLRGPKGLVLNFNRSAVW